jgi:hypothetical protein
MCADVEAQITLAKERLVDGQEISLGDGCSQATHQWRRQSLNTHPEILCSC